MNMFVMWMTGNTLSIFPIIMTVMMFKSPLTSLLSYKTTFQKLEGYSITFYIFDFACVLKQ